MARIDAGLFRDSGNGVEDANDDRVVEGRVWTVNA